jgi:hypothetical protein
MNDPDDLTGVPIPAMLYTAIADHLAVAVCGLSSWMT